MYKSAQIISRDTFSHVQAKLSGNADRKASPNELRTYAFLRMLVCTHCGAYMTGTKNSRYGHIRYICSNSRNFHTCRTYGVNEKDIMKLLVDTLERKFLDPIHLAEIQKEAKVLEAERLTSSKPANHRAAVAKYAKLIANAESNLALVPQSRVQPILDQIADWEIEKAKEERAMVEAGVSPTEEIQQTLRFIKEFLWEWREAMQRDDMSSVYHLLRQAVSKVELRFESVQRKGRMAHTLVGGQIYFLCGKPVEFTDATKIKPRKMRGSSTPLSFNYAPRF